MFLAEVEIKNFRQFDETGVCVEFLPGVTALVGPNDAGKSAIMDAVRYALSTTDHEYISVRDDDFHIREDGTTADELAVTCRFENLTVAQQGAFLEYLTTTENGQPVLYIHYKAQRRSVGAGRRWSSTTLRSGSNGDGPQLSVDARALLAAAYLRPLRDAERELSPGRSSRLSQVLQGFSGIGEGLAFDQGAPPNSAEASAALSLEGLVAYLHTLVNNHKAIKGAKTSINADYLSNLSLVGDELAAEISFVSGVTPEARLRHILERLELNLLNATRSEERGRYGLGSLNLLYMACELLLTEKEPDGSSLLLIEEPEAHLHPQRQLQLSSFLAQQAAKAPNPIQVILSTHSPILASKIYVENLVLVTKGSVRSLRQKSTQLSAPDYRFLQRFLDSTKANLFFARGVILVEGDAEQILLPTLARLLGKDLTKAGISVVNIGSTAHARYSRIFQSQVEDETVGQSSHFASSPPVAVMRDRDIMPHAAARILGRVKDDSDTRWTSRRRKWVTDMDPKFLIGMKDGENPSDLFEKGIAEIMKKHTELSGQSVRVFVSDHWTLEYDLAYAGLAEQVYIAAQMAKQDETLGPIEEASKKSLVDQAKTDFAKLSQDKSKEHISILVYKEFDRSGASKAIAAQYLCEILEDEFGVDSTKTDELRARIPSYIINALAYVTEAWSPDGTE